MVILNDNKILFSFNAFKYNQEYLSMIKKVNSNGVEVFPWIKYSININDLKKEIKDLTNANKEILTSYYLDKNYYSLYGLNYKKIYLMPKNNLEEIEIDVNKIAIHVFDSGLGFVELDYTVKSSDEKDINTVNYFLSEVKSDVKFKIVNQIWNSGNKTKKDNIEYITTDKFIKLILIDYDDIKDPEYSKDFKYMVVRPTLFSYIFLDEYKSDIADNIGSNFKVSYKVNRDVTKTTSYFTNSKWYYNINSITNVSNCVDDELTNSFFKTTFRDKVANLYFYLFLSSLHQKMYLLDKSYELKNIDYDVDDYKEMKNLCNSIILMKSNILKAKVKYFFNNPTFLEHINIFYKNVQETLLINEMKQSLDDDLEIINEFVEGNIKIISEYKELRQEKRKCIENIISLIIASLISCATFYDVYLKTINKYNIPISFKQNIVILFIILIIIFIIPTALNLKNNIKKLLL